MSEPHPIRVEKRKSFCGSPIQINVGTQTFYVHESMLRKSSKFFEAMLSKDWKEATTRIVDLPDDKPKDVMVYIDWLYTEQLAMRAPDITDDSQRVAARGRELDQLARLYCFGEKIQDKDFCNTIISAITETLDAPLNGKYYYFHVSCISKIYAGTPRGSPARRLLVQVYAHVAPASWLEESEAYTTHCPEFLNELAVELLTNRDQPAKELGRPYLERREEWFKKE